MNKSDVKFLKCVDCDSDLAPIKCTLFGERITYGLLRCTKCKRAYPILNSVGVFFRKPDFFLFVTDYEIKEINKNGLSESFDGLAKNNSAKTKQVLVAENWAYQHSEIYRFEEHIEEYSRHGEMFRKFIPICFEEIRSSIVCTACVGRGKEVLHVLKFGPEKVFVSEIGVEIYDLLDIFGEDVNKMVIMRCNETYSPIKDGIIDIYICDHAMQHIENRDLAFFNMVKRVRKGGVLSFCVYSYENNFLMIHVVEPMKKLLHRLSLKTIKALSYIPAAMFYCVSKWIYSPLDKSGVKGGKLPLYEDLLYCSGNRFPFLLMVCFDLLHAPISHHFKKDEIIENARKANLEIQKLVHTHGTTWSFVGRKR